eukprot:366279-Chlamydomonas_euryale.AAC.5
MFSSARPDSGAEPATRGGSSHHVAGRQSILATRMCETSLYGSCPDELSGDCLLSFFHEPAARTRQNTAEHDQPLPRLMPTPLSRKITPRSRHLCHTVSRLQRAGQSRLPSGVMIRRAPWSRCRLPHSRCARAAGPASRPRGPVQTSGHLEHARTIVLHDMTLLLQHDAAARSRPAKTWRHVGHGQPPSNIPKREDCALPSATLANFEAM